jgi:Tfp pilus assembly protein FimT
MRKTRAQFGFSAVELVVTCAIVATIAGIAILNVQSMLKNTRIDNAQNTTIAQLRLTRQKAVDERRVYLIRFQAPRSIQVYQVASGTGALTAVGSAVELPYDVEYRLESGIPNDSTLTPDNFVTHGKAIDFDLDYEDAESTDVRFHPDGSARDSKNRTNNGVIYIARKGELMSARAVSLFGATGRVRGWHPDKISGSFIWK